jgi:hypothetical protein
MTNDFRKKYLIDAQMEFGKVQRMIDEQKGIFKSTIWVDQKPMILAANEIWRLEQRLKDSLEIHKIILDNMGEA